LTDQAVLALEDGSVFLGRSIGADSARAGVAVGEVVFNTAMTGYQEILTDPSYARQLVTLTYPHIGNTGCNPEDEESAAPMAAGLIVRDCPLVHSNWRARESLPEYLERNGIVAIADIDTRRLTRILREKGAQGGAILTGKKVDADVAIEQARSFPGMQGMDLAREVTTDAPYEWTQGGWHPLERGRGRAPRGGLRFRRQTEHPAHAGGARLPRHGRARDHIGRRCTGPAAGRDFPFQRAGRPGTLRLRH